MEYPHFDFSAAFAAWGRIPVDDLDYFEAEELLTLTREQFTELIEITYKTRFDKQGWRNLNGDMERFMASGLPSQEGRLVVDFGCGLGLDALWFAMRKARVMIADMHPKLLRVAQCTVCTSGWIPIKNLIVVPYQPFFHLKEKVDLFWSLGVLHHTPFIDEILRRMCECLRPSGEIRIVLYSDRRWQEMTGEKAIVAEPVWKHPKFAAYTRACDTVGNYADWYNEEKIRLVVKDFAEVTECSYMGNDQFIGVAMKPRAQERTT